MNPHNNAINLDTTSPLLAQLIQLALMEDVVERDLTTLATGVSPDSRGDNRGDQGKHIRATLIAKSELVAAGSPLVSLIITAAGAAHSMKCSVLSREGETIKPQSPWLFLEGNPYDLLRLERTILNFLMRMSGIATETKKIVDLLSGTQTRVLHTRKTVPGHRETDIYAALIGGAHPHRKSLGDAILVKENHWRTAKDFHELKLGIEKFRSEARFVEVEVTNFIELKHALELKPDRILLDNFSVGDVGKAVTLFGSAVQLEASGGINETTARKYAETGVDYVSLGAITHSVHAADLSLLFDHRK